MNLYEQNLDLTLRNTDPKVYTLIRPKSRVFSFVYATKVLILKYLCFLHRNFTRPSTGVLNWIAISQCIRMYSR